MLLEFENSFHRTRARLRVPDTMIVSPRQEKRLWRALCGIDGCLCCGMGGVRGGEYRLEPVGHESGPCRVIRAPAR